MSDEIKFLGELFLFKVFPDLPSPGGGIGILEWVQRGHLPRKESGKIAVVTCCYSHRRSDALWELIQTSLED